MHSSKIAFSAAFATLSLLLSVQSICDGFTFQQAPAVLSPPRQRAAAAISSHPYQHGVRTSSDKSDRIFDDPTLHHRHILSSLAGTAATVALLVLFFSTALPVSAAAVDQQPAASSASSTTAQSYGISACVKPANGVPINCVSTSSVRQVDLYMAPWTWPDGTSVDEVVGRIKGVVDADPTLQLVEQRDQRYFRVRAARNLGYYDEIELVVQPADRVVIFRSQQVEGPESVSDFGGNRKRMENLRKQIPFLQVMGTDLESADSGPREGVGGQLKAFWGLQSGGGFEKVLLDDDDDY